MNRKYTMKQEIFIIENFDKLSIDEIVENLGVKRKLYHGKLHNLKRKYFNGKSPTTPEEKAEVIEKIKAHHKKRNKRLNVLEQREQFVMENYGIMDQVEMAEKLNVSNQTIYRITRKLKDIGVLPEILEEPEEPVETKRTKRIPKNKKIPFEIKERMKKLEQDIAELDGNLTIGRTYKITNTKARDEYEKQGFTGKLISKYGRYYLFQGKYRESFLKMDFVIGECTIEEV